MLDLSDPACLEGIGIGGIPSGNAAADAEAISSMVEVLSAAERSEGVPILASRYHSFLRAPEGLFANFHTGRLTPHKTVSEPYGDGYDTPVYELSVCRHCGQAYALGQERAAKEAPTAWLNPRHEGTDADDEFVPRTYYRILADESEQDPDEEVQWLCPTCGSLHDTQEGGAHRFPHDAAERIPIALNESDRKRANEDEARCRHCGYQSRVAIQPMRVSPEAAGSIVCYELVRDIPPFERQRDEGSDDLFASDDEDRARAGSVICFSDKRQDAAFFAPALERTYGSITRRQIIREAVETRGEGGCSPTAVVNWIAGEANRRYPGILGGDKQWQAEAWLLDELAAEDSRNSLDGLGVVRIEATGFNEGLEDPRAVKAVETMVGRLDGERFGWLTPEDYALMAKVCLELLRERNAIAVPTGVADLRSAHEARGNWVVLESEGSGTPKDTVLFAGSATGAENKRSAFIRKYARKVRGVELSREDATTLLRSLFSFTGQYLEGFFKGEGYLDGTRERFRLSKDIWTMYPHRDDDVIYRCDTCGCETHLFTGGVCTNTKCEGAMVASTFAESLGKDRHYKQVYQQDALPIEIEEHTAQLSSKKAREVQSSFIKGDVNVLSCTTTFELGVDVGDLRAIFMRNVPPTTANYTQRAGRVGRRSGMPGYAVTFARLRPHDIAYFKDPRRIIAGTTRAPFCYLDNSAIAKRHVFAVAMSEFFRHVQGGDGADYAHYYHDFMDLSKEEPPGLDELRAFLGGHPAAIESQLSSVVPEGSPVSSALGVDDWSWTDDLVTSQGVNTAEEGGRLVRAHQLKHADYVRIVEGIETNRGEDDRKAGNLMKTLQNLKEEHTISVLAENGILPKYGFPTDLVELYLPEMKESANDDRLELQRGLRQAIREYAPGAEVVAGKTLWKSVGLRRPRGRELQVRRYGSCPKCKSFVWPIENYSDTGTCPACGAEVVLRSKMLVPSYGFVGKSLSKGIGLRKPRSRGFAKVVFSQHWPDEAQPFLVELPNGQITARYAENAQLCALNETPYIVCNRCYAAAPRGESVPHFSWCRDMESAPHESRYSALGSAFVSDVLEIAFDRDTVFAQSDGEGDPWESAMWAIFAASAKMLEVPETELGGTYYRNSAGGVSIMVYDDVPGGAGHARQLADQVGPLLQAAYDTVADCTCGEDTCCYGCIANYYNQGRQASLSRGAAKRVLGGIVGRE